MKLLNFILLNINYTCLLYLFLIVLNNIIKIKTISESLLYFIKNNIVYIYIFVLIGFIGLPPMPIFFLKLNLLLDFLQKYNFFFFLTIIFYNIFIFFFYSNILNFFNIINKSPKYFYLFNIYFRVGLIFIIILFIYFFFFNSLNLF